MNNNWNKLIYNFCKYNFVYYNFNNNIYSSTIKALKYKKNLNKYKNSYLSARTNMHSKYIIFLNKSKRKFNLQQKLFFYTLKFFKKLNWINKFKIYSFSKYKLYFYYYLLQQITKKFNTADMKPFIIQYRRIYKQKFKPNLLFKLDMQKYLLFSYKFKHKLLYLSNPNLPPIIFWNSYYTDQILFYNFILKFNLYRLIFFNKIKLNKNKNRSLRRLWRRLWRKFNKFIFTKLRNAYIYNYNLRANPLRRRNRDLNTYNARSQKRVQKSFKTSRQIKEFKKFKNILIKFYKIALKLFFKNLICSNKRKNIIYNQLAEMIKIASKNNIYNLIYTAHVILKKNIKLTPKLFNRAIIFFNYIVNIKNYNNFIFSLLPSKNVKSLNPSLLFKKKHITSLIRVYKKYKFYNLTDFKASLSIYKKKYSRIAILNNNILIQDNLSLINFFFKKKLYNFYKIFKLNNKYYFCLNIILSNFFFKYKKSKLLVNDNLSIKNFKKKSNAPYFAYKIKLKPGFATLWRLIREQFKTIYKVNFKFQHALTKYINLISSLQVYYKLLYWYNNINYVFNRRFKLENNYILIYINGALTLHFFKPHTRVKKIFKNYIYVGDIIQLPINYKFIILHKLNFIFKNLIYINHDISTFSFIYLYYNNLLANWGFNGKYYNTLFSLKMYNWKYLT